MKSLISIVVMLLLLTTYIFAENNRTLKGEEMERMDIERFEKNKNNVNTYKFKLGDGTEIVQYGEVGKSFFETRIHPKTPLFEDYLGYFGTGELKLKGILYKKKFEYGIWIEYDKQGYIVKKIDYDKGFIYGWNDVAKYCNTNNIDLLNKFTMISKISRESIFNILYNPKYIRYKNPEIKLSEKDVFLKYETKEGKVNKVWSIYYKYSPGISRTIYIDAKQGNVIYIVEAPLSNGRPAYYDDKGAVFIDKSKIVEEFDGIKSN